MTQAVYNSLSKYASMVGNKYNYLTVLSLDDVVNIHQNILCKCDCGTIVKKRASQVYNNITVSCGCKRIVYTDEKIKELTGKKYNKLTILGFAYRDPNLGTFLKVLCTACNKEYIKRASHVLSAKMQSCGCLQYIKTKKINRK